MFGYATDETPELMPAAIQYAHTLARQLAAVRKKKAVDFLRPDGKTQVTLEYENDVPVRIDAIVVSTQHDEKVKYRQLREAVMELVIEKAIPKKLMDKATKIHVNPTGRFVIGGPQGDCGLTGRKIIVDSYGGMGRHGGGAFSGKDPSKVDRSACYYARYVAKNVVASGAAKRCEVQVAYAIGVAQPVGVHVNTFGTGKVPDDVLEKYIITNFDMRPKALIDELELLAPIYKRTAAYGHFGRSEFSWEKTHRAAKIADDLLGSPSKKAKTAGSSSKARSVPRLEPPRHDRPLPRLDRGVARCGRARPSWTDVPRYMGDRAPSAWALPTSPSFSTRVGLDLVLVVRFPLQLVDVRAREKERDHDRPEEDPGNAEDRDASDEGDERQERVGAFAADQARAHDVVARREHEEHAPRDEEDRARGLPLREQPSRRRDPDDERADDRNERHHGEQNRPRHGLRDAEDEEPEPRYPALEDRRPDVADEGLASHPAELGHERARVPRVEGQEPLEVPGHVGPVAHDVEHRPERDDDGEHRARRRFEDEARALGEEVADPTQRIAEAAGDEVLRDPSLRGKARDLRAEWPEAARRRKARAGAARTAWITSRTAIHTMPTPPATMTRPPRNVVNAAARVRRRIRAARRAYIGWAVKPSTVPSTRPTSIGAAIQATMTKVSIVRTPRAMRCVRWFPGKILPASFPIPTSLRKSRSDVSARSPRRRRAGRSR